MAPNIPTASVLIYKSVSDLVCTVLVLLESGHMVLHVTAASEFDA